MASRSETSQSADDVEPAAKNLAYPDYENLQDGRSDGQDTGSDVIPKVVYKFCDIQKGMVEAWKEQFKEYIPENVQVICSSSSETIFLSSGLQNVIMRSEKGNLSGVHSEKRGFFFRGV